MPELVSTTLGSYPLPDWAKEELADLKGHQKHDLIGGDEGAEVRSAYETAREEVVEEQAEAGLDLVVEGQLRWDDMLAHPLAVHDAVETRGIVRYYDNNNFYREPVVTGALDADGDVPAELRAASGLTDSLQAVLPGPYTLADLASDEHYGDEASFLAAVADFLAGEVAAAPDPEALLLLEPSLVASPPGDGADARASEAIDRVAGATDAPVVVFAPWGALTEKVHAHVLDAGVDALGYDLVSAPEDNLYNVTEYGTTDSVALGVVDGQNTVEESADLVAERVEWFRERTPAASFDRLYLAPDTELFYLPSSKVAPKLEALATAADAREVRA